MALRKFWLISVVVLLVAACTCAPPSILDLRVTQMVKAVEIAAPLTVKVEALDDGYSGSGVLILHKGRVFVLTCHHVIENDPHQPLQVEMNDGSILPAEYVCGDRGPDLCLLKVPSLSTNHPTMRISYDDLLIGERVLILGYPLGLGFSISSGVVSGTGKEVVLRDFLYGGSQTYAGLVLTDAPLNPGNSGGPVVDCCGRLIGIAQITKFGYDGIGLFISSQRIREFLNGATGERLD